MRRFIYLTSILLLSCGVKQPLDIGSNVTIASGSLFVNSQPPSASIFIDNILQSAVTPDTIDNIPVGRHSVKVFKKGYFGTFGSITVDVKKDSVHSVFFPLQIIEGASSIFVNTEPPGATIFIDGQNTGLQTPDTVEVQTGLHEISAVKNGFEHQNWQVDVLKDSLYKINSALTVFQRVLLELFGNVGCDPCVQGAENLERFNKEYSGGHYALFEYYANWPQPNDPFYHAVPQDVDQRVNYYTAYTLPTLIINGENNVDAQDYNQISNIYNTVSAAQNTPLAVSIRKQKTDSQLNIRVQLYDQANVLNNNQLRLFVALSEDSLHYDNPGGNGLTDFYFVFRGFLSSRQGDIINETTFVYDFDWPGAWNYNHSKVIAFIQDISTKKIIQTSIN